MSEEDIQGNEYLNFSQEANDDGNHNRQFNRYRGNKHNNRQRFGYGYNQQQPYNNHNRSQHNRSHRQDNSFSGGQHVGLIGIWFSIIWLIIWLLPFQKRGESSIHDYIHPSMWEDPWEHCRRGPSTSNDSFMKGKNHGKDTKEDLETGEGEFSEKSWFSLTA